MKYFEIRYKIIQNKKLARQFRVKLYTIFKCHSSICRIICNNTSETMTHITQQSVAEASGFIFRSIIYPVLSYCPLIIQLRLF